MHAATQQLHMTAGVRLAGRRRARCGRRRCERRARGRGLVVALSARDGCMWQESRTGERGRAADSCNEMSWRVNEHSTASVRLEAVHGAAALLAAARVLAQSDAAVADAAVAGPQRGGRGRPRTAQRTMRRRLPWATGDGRRATHGRARAGGPAKRA